jgi:PPOX class probable F420-dependent enzyme
MLTKEQKEFFNSANIGHLATINEDGTPQVTPVWVDVEGDQILVNTAEGRNKVKNIRRDPRVSVEVVDQDDPYKSVSVKGRVVEMKKQGADEHIDSLARKYLGQDRYPFRQPGEERIILRIEPEKVLAA